MGEKKYLLTSEELQNLVTAASREGVAAYRTEVKKSEKKKKSDKVVITKKKLASYRRVKMSLADTEEFTQDEKLELRWEFIEDLMGSPSEIMAKSENTVIDIEKKRKKDRFEIESIDRAMKLYKLEAERSTSEEFKRRYREVMAKYIAKEEKSVAEIAEIESITEKTVYKDLGIACKIIATYLLGM